MMRKASSKRGLTVGITTYNVSSLIEETLRRLTMMKKCRHALGSPDC